MNAKPKRRGPPSKPLKDKQSKRAFVNMTPAEFKRVTAEAKRQGFKSLSDFFMNPWRKES